jgi:hypothetical protein
MGRSGAVVRPTDAGTLGYDRQAHAYRRTREELERRTACMT